MSNRPDAFVVPAGLVFQQVDGALAIEHEGDIVLHGDLGQRLHSVRSNNGDVVLHIDADLGELAAPNGSIKVAGSLIAESVVARSLEVGGSLTASGVYAGTLEVQGDVQARELNTQDGGLLVHGKATVEQGISAEGGNVEIHGEVHAKSVNSGAGNVILHGNAWMDELSAGGSLALLGNVVARTISAVDAIELHGTVQADTIRADRVQVDSADLRVKVIQGRSSIRLGGGKVQADILIAPHVDLDPGATGRITVIEAHNELGASAVKGCLSLDDLEGMIGNVDRFLAERGLERLDADRGSFGTIDPPAVEADTSPAEPVDDQPVDDPPETDAPPAGDTLDLEAVAAPAKHDAPEDDESAAAAPHAARPATVEETDDADTFDGIAVADDEFTGDAPTDLDPNQPPPAVEPPADDEPAAVVEELFDLSGALDGDASDPDAWDFGGVDDDRAAEDWSAIDDGAGDDDWGLGGTTADAGGQASVQVVVDDEDDFVEDEPVPEVVAAPPPAAEPEAEEPEAEEPEAEEPEPEDEDPVYQLMVETVGRITECYEGVETPPAVERLHTLVEERAYGTIRDDITDIWNQLLKFHQKRGLRIQPQVTTTFNTINTIVRKL